MNEWLLSIIVPCYNSWNKMGHCIDFLEKNLPQDCEAIFVDDCSSDGTYENLLDLCQQKHNWKIFKNKTNSGPGVSRNVGIENSNSKYIAFLDADDWFAESYFDDIVPLLKKNIDCILYDYTNTDGNGWHQNCSILFCKNEVVELDIKKAFVFVKGATLGKAFRRQIAIDHKIRFLPDRIGEDIPFTKCMISYCESIKYIQKPLYVYYQHPNSLMHSNVRFQKNYSRKGFEYIAQKAKNGFEKELEAVYAIECLSSEAVTSVRNKKYFEWKGNTMKLEAVYPLYMENTYLKYLSARKKVILRLIKGHLYFALKMYVFLKDKVRR